MIPARRGLLAIEVAALCASLFVAGLFIGFFAARRAPSFIVPSEPVIGTMRLYGYLLSSQDRELYLRSVEYASENERVVGLVLRVDSPGGYASIVEDVYYALRRLSGKKPVVAVVEGLAASGGFYATLGANYTYVEPSSFIGNIGVVISTPEMVVPSEATMESGPYKHTGFPVHDFPLVVRRGLDNFLEAVRTGRGSRLNVTTEELSLGKLYIGSTAVELGIVDQRGSLHDAFAWAAEKAKATSYEVIDITQEIGANLTRPLGSSLWSNSSTVPLSLLRTLHREPIGAYYLSPYYIQGYRQIDVQLTEGNGSTPSDEDGEEPVSPPSLTNAVLVDEAHGNKYVPELLGTLFGGVIRNGFTISKAAEGADITGLLAAKPKAFIVITPTVEYSPEEVESVKSYVSGGGRLLFVYDPSITWAKYMNSLAAQLGVYFSDGYLFSLEENYGVYRNIVVRDFADHPLTANLKALTMFTATHIYGNATALARTKASTYLSLAEAQGVYTTIATSGNVTAIGDSTFLLDPFTSITDNAKFLESLIQQLTG